MATLVITSCTSKKREEPSTAGKMYLGEQHRLLMDGVREARSHGKDVEVFIVSAGKGMVHENEVIEPYNQTFSGLPLAQLARQARALHLPEDFHHLVTQKWDHIIIALGDDYLHAVDFDENTRFGGPVSLICSGSIAKTISRPQIHVTAVNNDVAKAERCGLIGLKGKIAARLLTQTATRSNGYRRR